MADTGSARPRPDDRHGSCPTMTTRMRGVAEEEDDDVRRRRRSRRGRRRREPDVSLSEGAALDSSQYFLSTASRSAGGDVRRPRPQIADVSSNRAGAVRMVKSRGSSAGVHFLPGQRRRDARELAGARAVGGRERLAQDVLQKVHVDGALRAALHHAFDRRLLRVARRDDRRDDLAEEHARLVRRVRRQRNVDVQAARARRLREARRLSARAARRAPSARRRAPWRTSRRRSDRDRSRRSPRRAATAPRENHGSCEIAAICVISSSVFSDPADELRRAALGHLVLVERLAADAVGEPLHHQRPIVDARQDVAARPRRSSGADRPW